MKFEYLAFEVEPFLRTKQKPSFSLTGLSPVSRYWTLTDAEEVNYAVTRCPSEAVRIPVFAVATSHGYAQVSSDTELHLSHGSLVFAMGLEWATKFLLKLESNPDFKAEKAIRAVVVLATNCHELAGKYRAYFGITVETTK